MAAAEHEPAKLTDRQLVGRFADKRCEAAFRELFLRHAPFVLSVCRRHLPTEQDAEDAAQATFLVLARKAGTVRWKKSISPWLYQVALRVASNLRRGIQRRREESQSPDIATRGQSLDDVERQHAREVFDSALSAMPKRYRDPLVLFYLEGHSRSEVADLLGLSPGAVKTRLERGRKRLRFQLAMRGVRALTAISLIQQASQAGAAESLAIDLLPRVLTSLNGPSTSSEVVNLATQEMHSMTISTLATKGTGLMVAASATLAVALPGLLPMPIADAGPEILLAQAASDPFGSDAQLQTSGGTKKKTSATAADPFGAAGGDPFGSNANNRPAASNKAADPFGSAGANGGGDPFGAMQAVTNRRSSSRDTVKGSNYSDGEKRILQTMRVQTQFAYLDTPLRDVLDDVQSRHRMPIVVDVPALEDYGVGTDTPISIELAGIPLRSGLNLMLRELDLTYIVQDDVVTITTMEEAQKRKQIRVYRLDGVHASAGEVLELMLELVADESYVSVIGERLVVKGDFSSQQQVMELLDALGD